MTAPRSATKPGRTHDVIVVGGGIIGAGIVQACAARGWRVLGLESRAIAAGTSSRSSKLIHGGLRYLETAQFSLVRESLRERRILRRIAPDLVRLVPFHIPVYRTSRRGPWMIRAGLSLYAMLGGLHRENRYASIDPYEFSAIDGLETDGLRAVFRYFDGQTDDALLTRAVIESARTLEADVRVPAELLAAECHDGLHHVTFAEGEREESAAAPVLVLATGPWTNETRARVSPDLPPLPLELVQGTHIEIPGTVEAGIYYLEAVADRRPMFVMPWRDRTLVGTTELRRASAEECAPTEQEIEYLRTTVEAHFPGRDTTVLDAWAGLRVLERAEGDANRRSREAVIDRVERDGAVLLTIAGGKLTGYRALAEGAVAEFERFLPRVRVRGRTEEMGLGSHPDAIPSASARSTS